jgi:hypothetical protein
LLDELALDNESDDEESDLSLGDPLCDDASLPDSVDLPSSDQGFADIFLSPSDAMWSVSCISIPFSSLGYDGSKPLVVATALEATSLERDGK